MGSFSRLALFACFVVFALLLVSSHVSARELSENPNTVDTSKPNEAEAGDAKWFGYPGYGYGWGYPRWGGWYGGYPRWGGGWGHWGGWH